MLLETSTQVSATPVLCLYGGKDTDPLRGQWLPAPERRVSILNFSGGKQSSCLAWMAIRGEIERPDVILTANPGMEASASLAYVKLIQEEARKVGIPAYTCEGPNLYEAILGLKSSGKKRFDTPAYYTKDPKGKREGKLTQRCTKWVKIAPMNRASRVELEKKLGISRKSSRLPAGVVEKWIGFSNSEVHRIKPPVERWSCFRYPLVDMGMSNGDVVKWFNSRSLPSPPRSVCNGCFANDAAYFKAMAEDPSRAADWAQALAVDEAIRDWNQIGVKNEVYILRSCISLKELAARGFQDVPRADRRENEGCNSGYCFV